MARTSHRQKQQCKEVMPWTWMQQINEDTPIFPHKKEKEE
jgi:hypothetical protein